MHVAHGMLMLVAWGFLIPAGALISRFWRGFALNEMPPRWLQLHRALNVLGLLCTLAGFGVSVAFVGDAGMAHFRSAHGRLGLATVILTCCQPLLAVGRPEKSESSPKSTARFVWEILHKGGGWALILLGNFQLFGGVRRSLESWGYDSLVALHGVQGGLLAAAALVGLAGIFLKNGQRVAAGGKVAGRVAA